MERESSHLFVDSFKCPQQPGLFREAGRSQEFHPDLLAERWGPKHLSRCLLPPLAWHT